MQLGARNAGGRGGQETTRTKPPSRPPEVPVSHSEPRHARSASGGLGRGLYPGGGGMSRCATML